MGRHFPMDSDTAVVLQDKEIAMNRYIDADALIERWNNMSVRGRTEFDQEIVLAPTIDAIPIEHINLMNLVEVVRCKECRRVREDGGHANCNGYLYCRKWKTFVDEDGFCSWGEGSE